MRRNELGANRRLVGPDRIKLDVVGERMGIPNPAGMPGPGTKPEQHGVVDEAQHADQSPDEEVNTNNKDGKKATDHRPTPA
jgi:hypothetical protein